MKEAQLSLCLRTSQDSLVPTVDEILQWSSGRLQNAGRWTLGGRFWTRNGSEWRNDGAVCSLSQILEDTVPAKYFLSKKACAGILRRAEKRGRELPQALAQVLRQVAESTSPDADERMM